MKRDHIRASIRIFPVFRIIRLGRGQFDVEMFSVALFMTTIEPLDPSKYPYIRFFYHTGFFVPHRFIGSVRRECLDHILILNERHLKRIIGEYVDYFNHARPHQGIGQRIPDPLADNAFRVGDGQIFRRPVLGGLHHDYRRVPGHQNIA